MCFFPQKVPKILRQMPRLLPGVLTLETGAYSRVTVQRHAPFRLLRLGKQQAVCSRLRTPFTSKPAPFLALLVRRPRTAPASSRKLWQPPSVLSVRLRKSQGRKSPHSVCSGERADAAPSARNGRASVGVPFATKRYASVLDTKARFPPAAGCAGTKKQACVPAGLTARPQRPYKTIDSVIC